MKWEKGDIIQIHPSLDAIFGGALMIVDEPKSWGAQGYVNLLEKGHAYYRLKFDNGTKVGHVEWIYDDEGDEPYWIDSKNTKISLSQEITPRGVNCS